MCPNLFWQNHINSTRISAHENGIIVFILRQVTQMLTRVPSFHCDVTATTIAKIIIMIIIIIVTFFA